ncbi:MAG: NADPH:quinone oxidoreductase family protein [Actinomycetes bacterium]
MKAIVCENFGPVTDLRLIERESAPVGPGDVRVDVTACGVNYVDGLFVQGKYQIKPPVPFVPGMEVVGRIVEIGSEVTERAIDDRVFVNVGLGGYVDEVVVGAPRTMLLPDTITDGQAATFTQSYLTGWFALRERAHVEAGQSILVLGAGSGVGLAAVDIASTLGLRVIATASTEEKRELALSRGAEAVIDSTTEDVKERAKELGGGSVDVLYDPIGGDLGTTCLRALGDNGAYLVIGFVAGIPNLPANQILLRNRRVIGVDWGGWALRNAERNDQMVTEVLAEIAAGRLDPVEPVRYSLADAAQALTDLEERRVAGKAILVP